MYIRTKEYKYAKSSTTLYSDLYLYQAVAELEGITKGIRPETPRSAGSTFNISSQSYSYTD